MLGWIKTKIAEALAENNIRNETASVMKAIDKCGGADKIVFAYVDYFAKNDEKMARFRNGCLKSEEYPMKRIMIGTAAIKSIMAARLDLAADPNDEDAKSRLSLAEYAFLLSWLHLEEKDIAHITQGEIDAATKRFLDVMSETQDVKQAYAVMPHRKVADERMQLANEALSKWRATDVSSFSSVFQSER